MYDIDRSLLVVKPKKPFFDWVQAVSYDEDLTLEDVREDASAYLIPELESPDEEAEILKKCYEDIFGSQLSSWYIDPQVWPQQRDFKMFLEWFDIEFHSLVFDLLNEPIETLDYGLDNDVEPGSNGN
jgi:hypothetical protein